MKFKFVLSTALALLAMPLCAEAMPTDWTKVFECSVGGGKMVTVRAMDDSIVYEFGTAADKSLTIPAVVTDGSVVLYRTDRYAGIEQQWRFRHKGYSYIVYEMDANGDTGTSGEAGLNILNGKKVVSRRSCRSQPRMDAYDSSAITEDSEDFSAMSVGD